jgi:hypothetical protein
MRAFTPARRRVRRLHLEDLTSPDYDALTATGWGAAPPEIVNPRLRVAASNQGKTKPNQESDHERL